MDPITFGMVAIGIAVGSLVGVHIIEQYGIKINDTAITLVLELLKTGGILYLLEHILRLFL